MSKVAVIGNTARAIGAVCASDMTLSGHQVRFAVFPEQKDQLPALRAAGGFTVDGGAQHLVSKKAGFAKLDKICDTTAEALRDAEVVLIEVDMHQLEKKFSAMIPEFARGAVVHVQSHGYWPAARLTPHLRRAGTLPAIRRGWGRPILMHRCRAAGRCSSSLRLSGGRCATALPCGSAKSAMTQAPPRTMGKTTPIRANWMIDCMTAEPGGFVQKQPLPEAWAGLQNGSLAERSGVADAVFVHLRRFVGAEIRDRGFQAFVLAFKRRDLRRIFRDRRRRTCDDESAQPGLRRLIVRNQAAVVSDQRIGHQHHLPRVARIGADLLVARLAGVHHEVATRGDGRTPRDAGEDAAIFQGEQGGSMVADARIDNRCRLRKRDQGAAIGCEASRSALVHLYSSPASQGHLRSLWIVAKGTPAFTGEPGGIRTHDLVIKSHLLYR